MAFLFCFLFRASLCGFSQSLSVPIPFPQKRAIVKKYSKEKSLVLCVCVCVLITRLGGRPASQPGHCIV